jgi:hypothetical protein
LEVTTFLLSFGELGFGLGFGFGIGDGFGSGGVNGFGSGGWNGFRSDRFGDGGWERFWRREDISGRSFDCLESPVNVRIDCFEPGHAENDRMDAERGDNEGLSLGNASDREFESDLTIGVG